MEKDWYGLVYCVVIWCMGWDGRFGVGWLKEFGGLGFGLIEQQIFVNEVYCVDVLLFVVMLQIVGFMLQVYGSELQKKKFLLVILVGEVYFVIGYIELEVGIDLVLLCIIVVCDGDYYIVNGQKVFIIGVYDVDYIWLVCCIDLNVVKYKGIFILIVDIKDFGYFWMLIILVDGVYYINVMYYNDVCVLVDMLVGKENDGWWLIII